MIVVFIGGDKLEDNVETLKDYLGYFPILCWNFLPFIVAYDMVALFSFQCNKSISAFPYVEIQFVTVAYTRVLSKN